MAEAQPLTLVEGATTGDVDDEIPEAAKSAEDRKAAAALSSLDATREDESATGKDVDQEAIQKAMARLAGTGTTNGTSKNSKKEDEKKVVKKAIKVDPAYVTLLWLLPRCRSSTSSSTYGAQVANNAESFPRSFPQLQSFTEPITVMLSVGMVFLEFLVTGRTANTSTPQAAIMSRGIVSPSTQELLRNTIGFVIPTWFLFALRIINATWVLRRMFPEDYIIQFFYSSLLVLLNVSAHYNTNLFPPSQLQVILANPEDVVNRIIGSKIVIALEQCMLISTWGVKICIWLFLNRLCRQLPSFQRALIWLLYFIIFGYVVIQVLYYAVLCRPFNQYWAIEVKDSQCATYQYYSIVQMTFNISSDLGLVIIPCCMFIIAQLPLRRKALLMIVFSCALFTILCAILNKVYNFKSPLTTTYQLWYIRESSVAICVGNMICCWQIMQRLFKLRSFDNRQSNIVLDPEMARRRENPRYGPDGTLRDSAWWDRMVAIRIAAGDLVSLATERAKGTFTRTTRTRSGSDGLNDRQRVAQFITGQSYSAGETYIEQLKSIVTTEKAVSATTPTPPVPTEEDLAIRYRHEHDLD
ncbi:hypothetical protein B7494_g3533 [Chlorociboria aeruginascens]|nr:hypothetical protein B7494_g3533 [Chlorociboria aeruginascens]